MKAIFFEHLPYKSDFYVGSHQYARRFLKDGWEIFWFSHPLSPLHLIYPKKRDFEIRTKSWRKGPIAYENNSLLFYSPFTLLPSVNIPLLRNKLVAVNSLKFAIPGIKSVLEKTGFYNPDLIWITNPIFSTIAKELDSKKTAYRVADDLTSYWQVSESYSYLQNIAFSISDKVFVVSNYLLDKISERTDNAILLPNAADFELFQKTISEPDDLKSISKPRIIYVGVTEETFDVKLIRKCALSRPNYSFIFVGKRSTKLNSIISLENVFVLGPKSHDDIPDYLKCSDVAIIPFLKIPIVETLNPIKLYEYLAAGLPVVSTKWKEIESINPPIYFAERDNFVKKIDLAIKERDKGKDKRIKFAKENSWAERYRFVKETLSLK